MNRDNQDQQFSIRRDVLNLTIKQWGVADAMDLRRITPREWIEAMTVHGGKGGFLTALLNSEEREFVRLVYLPTPKAP